uniref:Uncharacterized protein n=1 Tax=viral metagenome TaxID=1070528 RepID=A0A6C0HNG3_9ZZZZ
MAIIRKRKSKGKGKSVKKTSKVKGLQSKRKSIKRKSIKRKSIKRKSIKRKTPRKLTKSSLAKIVKVAVNNSSGRSKSQSNLASKIINMSSNDTVVSSHSKAQQSSYASITVNGKTKEYGQAISTDSSKPYINAVKLNNGKLYISRIPKQ